MRVRNVLITASIAALMALTLAACQKNEQEAERFPRADDDSFRRKFSEMVSYQLPNGVSVYLQQDSTYNQVAIEVFFRAGFAQEPKGKPQVSHLAEHCVVFSPTEHYKTKEASEFVGRGGKIAAEAVGDFVHFDFVVQQDKFDELMKIISEQLTSIKFDESVREEHAKRAAKEITTVLESDRASLSKFAFITFLQAVQHGETSVPIYQANFDRSLDDLTAFHKERYRTNDMVIAVIGNVDVDHARAVVSRCFSDIPKSPEPPRYTATIDRDMRVKWDIDADCVFLVYPGPYGDERERAALVAFGSYLHQYLARDLQMPTIARATYTTNPTYSLQNIPFFVFAQPEQYRSVSEVQERVTGLVDQAVASVDEDMFRRIIGVLESFLQSSIIESARNDYSVDNHVVLGQQGVNTGVKHYFLNGRTADEYIAMLDTITYEEFKEILARHLAPEKRRIVTISGD